MKDLHNHLLYGIDDGSRSYQESIEILSNLESEGVTSIVVTPHYISGSNYNSNNKEKKELLKELQKSTNIKLYLGNEIFIDNRVIDEIKNGNISSINNSRYILIELPLHERLEHAKDILFRLRNEGYIPIIAHPERYHYIDLDELMSFIEMGCLLQGNITSLNEKYGKNARLNLELLLKKRMIYVLGTDTHSKHKSSIKLCCDKLKKIIKDNNIYEDLVNNNFERIVNDKDVPRYEIISTKKLFQKEKIK